MYSSDGNRGAAKSIYSGVVNLEREAEVSPEQESRIRVLEADVEATKTYRKPQK